ncbi:MAG: carboxypeptidase-like regulatory domain-containing protein [Bacteroidota bacterium]
MSHQQGMRFGAILSLLLYFVLAIAAVATTRPAGGSTIYGRVTDRSTGAAVEFVNIFLANTTRGGSTDQSGRYIITGIPPGSYELVASRVGFEVEVKSIRVAPGDSLRHDFRLPARIIQEREIQVTAVDPAAWRDMLGVFKEQFIGTETFAGECRLMNPEVLDFEKDAESDVLFARTDSVLHFENRALGYRLHILLNTFRWSHRYNRLFYKHYARFELMQPDDPGDVDRWASRRADAYLGSKRHFLRSLFAGTTQKEGFAIFRGSLEEILRGEGWHIASEDLTIAERVSSEYVRLSFQGFLRVQYSEEEGVEKNYIALPEGPAFIDANGFVLEPRYLTVLSQSAWARNRIARLLPMDYETAGEPISRR